jgi:hypothetical protein
MLINLLHLYQHAVSKIHGCCVNISVASGNQKQVANRLVVYNNAPVTYGAPTLCLRVSESSPLCSSAVPRCKARSRPSKPEEWGVVLTCRGTSAYRLPGNSTQIFFFGRLASLSDPGRRYGTWPKNGIWKSTCDPSLTGQMQRRGRYYSRKPYSAPS